MAEKKKVADQDQKTTDTKKTETTKKETKKTTHVVSKKKSVEKTQVWVVVKRHDNDTWSPEVQISSLTDEITMLQWHIKKHVKDFDAKRCLLKKVARRRTFLKYLKLNNLERYLFVSKKLWLKV